EDARVALLALIHPVLRAVDLRIRLAEDLDEREHHHRPRRVTRIGGRLRPVLTEPCAAGFLGDPLEDAPEDGAVLASLTGSDLTDLLREMPLVVGLSIVPEVPLRSGERALVPMRRLERAVERFAT